MELARELSVITFLSTVPYLLEEYPIMALSVMGSRRPGTSFIRRALVRLRALRLNMEWRPPRVGCRGISGPGFLEFAVLGIRRFRREVTLIMSKLSTSTGGMGGGWLST